MSPHTTGFHSPRALGEWLVCSVSTHNADIASEHSASHSCVAAAGASQGRRPVPVQPRTARHVCGGSNNTYVVDRMVRAAIGAGLRRLVVVGGSPSTRREPKTLVAGRLDLRLIDGTARRSAGQSRNDLVWADLVIVWGNTQLAHRVSLLYTRRSGAHAPVITVVRRGAAGLAEGLMRHVVVRERKPDTCGHPSTSPNVTAVG
jgi:hypothetical protein